MDLFEDTLEDVRLGFWFIIRTFYWIFAEKLSFLTFATVYHLFILSLKGSLGFFVANSQ